MGVMVPLAEIGASFYLVARDKQKLESVRLHLLTLGAVMVDTEAMDLNDIDRHEPMFMNASRVLGQIDMALIAHGILGDQELAERSFAEAASVLETNLFSPVSLITWLANYFAESGRGILAVISSVAGDRGRKSNYVYGASKGGLNIFLDGVRNRIDRLGVQVLTIKPGFVATPMTANIPQGPLFAQPSTVGKGILRAIEKRKDIVYVPGFWALIMFVIRSVPGSIFKKLNL